MLENNVHTLVVVVVVEIRRGGGDGGVEDAKECVWVVVVVGSDGGME